MKMPAALGQVAPAQEAGRPQPQTTVEPAGGPFIRHSQVGRRSQYSVTGIAFSGLVTQPLVAVPGYIRGYNVRIANAGGSGTTTVTAAADAPWSCVQQVTLRDAFGTPLIIGPGFETLYLIPKYSGQVGAQYPSMDPESWGTASGGSFSNVATGASATGAFSFATVLPLEFSKAYGVISGANAALLPSLQFQFAPASSVFGVAPNTSPGTMSLDLDADFYWLPEGAAIEPPGLGTTCQWVMQNCNPTIGSQSTTMVALPRLGGYLHTLIFILRDSTGARIEGYGTRLRIYVDGVPLIDTRFDTFCEDMYRHYGLLGTTALNTPLGRDTGVIVLSRRNSLSQMNLGLLDTGETYLSTNPGTLVQVECSPWGTISNAPATLQALVGQVVPAGTLIQGLPEL